MRLSVLAVLVTLLIPGVASAQQKSVMIELFTSQGCSSCPPADALLHDLAKREEVLALSLHVDYWDYIGWKDVFGSPENTRRQYAYAAATGSDMVYTPQMMINGRVNVVGNRVADVQNAIQQQTRQPQLVQLEAQRRGQQLQISARAKGKPVGALEVWLVRYQPQARVEITRGENAGRTLTYTNVVHSVSPVGRWDGRSTLDLTVALKGDLAAAVFLQTPRMGPVVAVTAAR